MVECLSAQVKLATLTLVQNDRLKESQTLMRIGRGQVALMYDQILSRNTRQTPGILPCINCSYEVVSAIDHFTNK